LQAFGERLARGDADGVATLFTEDATYAEPPHANFVGRAAMRGFVADFAARHHDTSFVVTHILTSADDHEAAAHWRFAYTRDDDDKRRVYEGMSFVTFAAGQIASWRGFSALIG
jgi:ketosteroid isomerase-like protein